MKEEKAKKDKEDMMAEQPEALLDGLIEAKVDAKVAERIRLRLEQQHWAPHENFRVTASFGVADLDAIEETATVQRLVERADVALYESKQCGRNMVTIASGVFRRAV